MTQTPADVFAALEATWPPVRIWQKGPWRLRAGAGGGKRVSAANAQLDVREADIELAEAEMRDVGQTPLFVLYDEADPLDEMLGQRGYRCLDPTVALLAPVGALTDEPIPPVTTFEIWEPLAIMREIWAAGGIGPARLDVMSRAQMKTAILARAHDKPAGTAFVAKHRQIAMVHAVEVLPTFRRQGMASWIMRAAALWADRQGAETLAVLCTRANAPALSLYSALGFRPSCGYHYRQLDT
ncbi:MAG: GNAT family N-acetyltransferase [Pseudomonadota bacterium]